MNISQKFFTLIFITGCAVFSISLVRSIFNLQSTRQRIMVGEQKLDLVKEKNEILKRKLASVQSNQYIEQQAREKLNLGRDNEIVVLLPSIDPSFVTPTPVDKGSNIERWWKVFTP